MTITFRIDDGNVSIIPATRISADQLVAFVTALNDTGERNSTPMTYVDYGAIGDPVFSIEARVCPLSLAAITAVFDQDPAVIAVVDEAQYLGRRVRIHRDHSEAPIVIELANNADAAPAFDLINANAHLTSA